MCIITWNDNYRSSFAVLEQTLHNEIQVHYMGMYMYVLDT